MTESKVKYLKTKVVKSVSFDAILRSVTQVTLHDNAEVDLLCHGADQEALEELRALVVDRAQVRVKLTVIP